MAIWLIRLQFLLLSFALSVVYAQQTFWPAAVPLAVRTPYLNAWQVTQNGTRQNPYTDWSQFWTRKHVMAWSGFIRVDDINWKFLGGWPNNVNDTVLESTTITPTRTIVRILCGPVAVNMTFLSPIETDDLVKRSLPFSYMYVDVESLDGAAHSIKLYTDISGEWASNSNNNVLQWDTLSTTEIVYHSLRRQVPLPLVEDSNISEDSTFYYGMLSNANMQWQTGAHDTLRNSFTTNGVLAGGKDTAFRTIGDRFPVFAYSVDMGTITNTASPIVWVIGQDHDPSVQYSPDGTLVEKRSSYWKSKYNVDVTNAISDFLKDFTFARDRAIELDKRIMDAAEKVSPAYSNLVSLAARQVFASTETTTIKNADGAWNVTNVKAFMKNMGSKESRVNAVEMLYASLPMFLYLDPSYIGHLLEPLLQYQSSPAYFVGYAAPDIGTFYPNATGNSREHDQGVEQCANMIILSLAHARYTGDGTLLSRYYTLLKKWADYLVANSLNPTAQITSDGLNQPGNSNLAIKGIIAIKAMSEISKAVKQDADSGNYSSTASNLVGTWQSQAMPGDHILLRYGNSQSDGLVYNLYADKLLKTNLVPEQVYSNQAAHYESLLQTASIYGIAYDNTVPAAAKSHWTMFTAAALRGYSASEKLVSSIHNRASSNSTPGVFPASYRTDDGKPIEGEASPALGAMFAFLALDLEPKEITATPGSPGGPSSTTPDKQSSSNAGTIAGAIVGSIAGIALIGFAAFFFWRKKQDPKPHIEYNPQLMFAPQYPTSIPTTGTTGTMVQHEPRVYTKGDQPRHIPATSVSTAFTHPPISPTAPPTSLSGNPSDSNAAEMLRNEVADLRREMDQMRERAAYDEPPPQYPS